jgi:Fe-S-cluster-containing hydrogenase component 2
MEPESRHDCHRYTEYRGGIMESQLPAEFVVNVDHEKCRRCKRCVINCSFSAIEFKDKVTPNNRQCMPQVRYVLSRKRYHDHREPA